MNPAAQIASEETPRYAQVAIPVHLHRLFTYRLPSSMQGAQPGSRVIVQLGTKAQTGYIVALLPRLRAGTSLIESEIKDVQELLDIEPPLTSELLELTHWVSDYYAAPWGEVLRAALPAGINATVEQRFSIAKLGLEKLQTVQKNNNDSASIQALRLLADEGDIELNAFRLRMGISKAAKWPKELETAGLIERSYRTIPPARAKRSKMVRVQEFSTDQSFRLTEKQQRAVDTVKTNGNEMAVIDLLKTARVGQSVITTLIKKAIFEEFEQEVRRDPLAHAQPSGIPPIKLNQPQTAALESVTSAMRDGQFTPMLLHGVTGSGKTEIYLRAMRVALEMNRGALMLVPEIALTPILSRRLRAHFGDDIAILHSSLSRGERFDEWSRLRRGEARVALGTRSAIFAPVQNPGLIIVDEEHDTSYRQEESPSYNARDAAIVQAQKASAVIVLGSATPSLESFHNAETSKYRYLPLPERVANRPMARAEIVDMRAAFAKHQRPVIFSDKLLEAIEDTHLRNEQTIILLNRRGYSSFILCRSCGESIMCPNCEVTLTYHRSDRTLVCHYCNHRERSPSQCPVCASKYIYYVGEGTEQIEEVLRKRFPGLRIGRIDRDTKSRRHTFEQTLLDFSSGNLDLLVGTQMLAKGHDFPNVTLVGVVSVDAGLALPDFRAAERTFQLITQVAGRAGRGHKPGRVLIQSYHPEHYALRQAASQDFAMFYREEIKHRRNHAYPPFVALAILLIRYKEAAKAQAIAADLRRTLMEANQANLCRVLGPAPAPLSRLRGEFRMQILIKSRSRKQLRKLIDDAMTRMETRGGDLRAISIEIDPVSMM